MAAPTPRLVDAATGTTIAEVAPGLHRISQPVGADVRSPVIDVKPANPFSNNAYLIEAPSPLLYLTGFKGGWAALRDAVATVVDPRKLRYLAVTLWARDQMGALRLWLEECPQLEVVCSEKMVETRTGPKGIKRVKSLKNGETLDLGGGKVLDWIDCPNHFNGAPECGFLFERSSRTLFCGDLFSHTGAFPSPLITAQQLLAPDSQFDFDFSDPRVRSYFDALRGKEPRMLATMHGGAYRDDAGCAAVMDKWVGMHMARQEEKARGAEARL
ncbi:beta-lactamase-like protein [Hyaloraphidium curvatum]|nr:beta-lactamase-like protein [Hyaloraphidium curvatum]